MNYLAKAIALASRLFEGTTELGGNPYILHCIRVMNGVNQQDSELMQIAILHDVPEDTDVTIEVLRRMGYSERVLLALTLLNHESGVSYEDYIKRFEADWCL